MAEARFRQAIDQFNLHRSRNNLFFVLQPVARADFVNADCLRKGHNSSSIVIPDKGATRPLIRDPVLYVRVSRALVTLDSLPSAAPKMALCRRE